MSHRIRLGLIGAGTFGKILAQMCQKIPDYKLVAVYDRIKDNALYTAQQFNLTYCDSLDDLLDLDNVDAVIIASSHDMHHPHVLAAASAGKHIFCEKPMAINTAQCQEMIDAAQENQVKLLIGHVTRLFPSVQRLYNILDSNIIGRPLAMKILRSGWVERRDWWSKTSSSGGMMHSSGAHMYDLMGSIFGTATSVYAVAAPQVQLQTDFEDTIFSTVTYESGAIGTVDVSISGTVWVYGGGLICENGSLHFQFRDDVSWIEHQVRGQAAQRETFGAFEQEGLDGIVIELQNFVDMILHEEQPFISNSDAMAAIALI